MIDGIIFDLDGTLWDSSQQVVPAWNTILTKYNQKNITSKDMTSYMGKTLDIISKLILPNLPENQAMNIMYECCAEEQVYLSQHGGKLYQDLEKTLQKLKEKYKLYIVSNCQLDYLNAFFTAHKLKHYFSDYECSGNTGLPKSENIKMIIRRNNLKRAIYVGDTQLDMESSHSAGIPFVFAQYGFGNVSNAEYEINCLTDLFQLNFMEKIYEETNH